MGSAVSDATIVKLMRQGLGARKIQHMLGMGLDTKRLQRLRRQNDIPKQQVVQAAVGDDVLMKLIALGYGRKRIEKAIGRSIQSSTINRVRRKMGLPIHSPGRLSDADLRPLVLRGLLGEEIKQITGVLPDPERVSRMRKEFGIPPHTRSASLSAKRANVTLLDRVRRAFSNLTDPSLRDDAVSDMLLDILNGTLSAEDIEHSAKRYCNAQFAQWQSKFGPRSLDDAGSDGDWSLLDTLEDSSALEAFDRIFNDEADETW